MSSSSYSSSSSSKILPFGPCDDKRNECKNDDHNYYLDTSGVLRCYKCKYVINDQIQLPITSPVSVTLPNRNICDLITPYDDNDCINSVRDHTRPSSNYIKRKAARNCSLNIHAFNIFNRCIHCKIIKNYSENPNTSAFQPYRTQKTNSKTTEIEIEQIYAQKQNFDRFLRIMEVAEKEMCEDYKIHNQNIIYCRRCQKKIEP